MISPPQETIDRIKDIFKTQKFAALATQEQTHPYLSLMAYAFSDDLRYLLVATSRGTRKYSNMIKTPGVSFLIDNRTTRENDLIKISAVTGIGMAEEIEGAERGNSIKKLLEVHPDLVDFAALSSTALIKIKVIRYIIISRFEKAEELKMMDL